MARNWSEGARAVLDAYPWENPADKARAAREAELVSFGEAVEVADLPLAVRRWAAKRPQPRFVWNGESWQDLVGAETAKLLKDATIGLYSKAADYALGHGIIIADTKFEFGKDADGSLILADEVLTPDSSRFWPQASYAVGANPPSLDKQYVRDWLDSIHFNHQPPGPVLPDDVIARTREIYVKAYEELSGKKLV